MFRHVLVLTVAMWSAVTVHAAGVPNYIAQAVADAGRPEADKARDANRRPAETLVFAEVKPGQQIAELLPGGGYFTRILAKAAGAQGHVFALAPPKPANAPADAQDRSAGARAIAADPAYGNVTIVDLAFASLATPVPVDLIFTALNYHDLHNVPNLDVAVFNKAVFDALKSGGLYVVVDHAAQPGSGVRDTSTLHRIDEATVKQEVLQAGFKFVERSALLAEKDDARTAKVFDPSIRGKTDQFILKFRKPKG